MPGGNAPCSNAEVEHRSGWYRDETKASIERDLATLTAVEGIEKVHNARLSGGRHRTRSALAVFHHEETRVMAEESGDHGVIEACNPSLWVRA